MKIVTFLFISLFFINNAWAYLDPGTGSFVIQIVIAAIAGSIFTLKLYWKHIKTFITKKFTKSE